MMHYSSLHASDLKRHHTRGCIPLFTIAALLPEVHTGSEYPAWKVHNTGQHDPHAVRSSLLYYSPLSRHVLRSLEPLDPSDDRGWLLHSHHTVVTTSPAQVHGRCLRFSQHSRRATGGCIISQWTYVDMIDRQGTTCPFVPVLWLRHCLGNLAYDVKPPHWMISAQTAQILGCVRSPVQSKGSSWAWHMLGLATAGHDNHSQPRPGHAWNAHSQA